MTFKVPFLADAQLESAAQELLRRYAKWKGEPPRPPIPVDAIAEGVLGLTLELNDLRKKLGKPDVLGATWLDEALVLLRDCPRSAIVAVVCDHEGTWQRGVSILGPSRPMLAKGGAA